MKTELKKALTVANVLSQKTERIPFEGEWYEAFGNPQDKGVWFVWGTSGSGKSYFTMRLAKELAKTMKVLYNLLEEETDDTDYIDRMECLEMHEVSNNFLTARYELAELAEYLQKRNSPDVVVVDSLIYFLNSFDDYLKLKRRFKNKIFIFTGHAQGAHPRSELEVKVQFDAKMKIYVNGYLASCKGRTIGPNGGQFITWADGCEKLRGKQNE